MVFPTPRGPRREIRRGVQSMRSARERRNTVGVEARRRSEMAWMRSSRVESMGSVPDIQGNIMVSKPQIIFSNRVFIPHAIMDATRKGSREK